MIAYGYARVSTAAQEDKTSLDSQAQAIQQYCTDNSLDLLRVWRETYTGAELFDRPVLNQVRADIRARSIGALVVYAVDRLSRDVGHLAFLIDECERHGVALHFVTEKFDATPEGKLLQSVRSYAAEIERLKIRERTVRGKRARLERGHLPRASSDLFGYRLDKASGRRAVCEAEADIVRLIFDLYVNRRLGVASITRQLQRDGIPPPTATKRQYATGKAPAWSKSTVTRILREPAYTGQSYGWRWQSRGRGKRRTVTERPRDQWIMLGEGLTPAIIDSRIFETAAAELSKRRCAAKGVSKRESLLRGFIWCPCGSLRTPDYSSNAYRCTSRHGLHPCDHSSVPMAGVERAVWQALLDAANRPDVIESMVNTQARRQADPDGAKLRLDALRQEVKRITRQQAILLDQSLEAEDEWQFVFKTKKAELTHRRRQVEAELKELQAALSLPVARVSGVERIRALSARLNDRLNAFSLPEKRTVLVAFGVRVVAAGRDDVRITLSLIID